VTVKILQGDCREVMRTLADASVDAIVTDPPYELTSARPGGRSEATRGKVMGGFMGMKWDGTGVAFDQETWREAQRVLKPGGYLLAFSGTRTYHRMTCAIEDAGFEIRDQIGWAYGSGFPKSHNGPWGGTALKPAWEPIVMARKPLVGTVEANWRKHGTGALNIDGCRIPVDDEAYARNCSGDRGHAGTRTAGQQRATSMQPGGAEANALGRWPANIVHDGSDEVLQAFPKATGQKANLTGAEPSSGLANVYEGSPIKRPALERRGDAGSAARFFYCAKADRADRNAGLSGMPERTPHPAGGDGRAWDIAGSKSMPRSNHHPTVKPTDLMRWLCRLVTPRGGLVLDPFMGSGSTLKAAELEGFSAIGIELDPTYIEIARRRVGADAPLLADVEVTA
jgi:site-specific DNA-methyltransferase (adenine-specific)